MSLVEILMARKGTTPEDFKRGTRLGKVFRRNGVADGPDLRRVLGLPNRVWSEDEAGNQELADRITDWLRTPAGTMRLRPVQAKALEELHDLGGLLAPVRVGGGKCLGRGTSVLMYDGRILPVERVCPGDALMGPDSAPRIVLSTTSGWGPLVQVAPTKGEAWICNDVHMLTLVESVSGEVLDISAGDFMAGCRSGGRDERKLFQPEGGVDFPERPEPAIDPYFFGVWLGDGSHNHRQVAVTKPDSEILSACTQEAHRWGLRVATRDSNGTRCPTHFLVGDKGNKNNPLLNELRKNPVDRVPEAYRCGSRRVRLLVLAGLVDTDGYVHHGGVEIVQVSRALAEDIAFVARSLGFRTTLSCKKVNGKDYWRQLLIGDCSRIPCRIARKKAPARMQKKNPLRTGFQVFPAGTGDYFGFELTGDGRFLLGDFTVTHNTLVSMLAPVVLGAERPLLFVPAALKGKTIREFATLRRHWLFHPRMRIMTYEVLSRDGGYEDLESFRPDLIVADECHRLRHGTAGCTRKAARWAREHPETRWALMSGTITSRSLRDYAHLAKWSLRDLSPLPHHGNVVADWADAIDEKVPADKRLMPGLLLGLCDDAELAEVAADPRAATPVVRRAFRRRLTQTPGVVATDERALGVSLRISARIVDVSAACAADFRRLREDWETPDGHPFSEALDLWRHARSLGCGIFNRWDPPAPAEWLSARREWARFVRESLARRMKNVDTEFQVAKACLEGRLPRGTYDAWTAVRDSFKPQSVAVWRHEEILRLAANWMAEGPGIVWVEHVAFGERLSEITGRPYFREKGLDAHGRPIEDASGAVIASIASNKEGRNLQKWNRSLVVSPPPNGSTWEQVLGRTHREGQLEDEVSYEVVLACREAWEGLRQAMRDARYVQDTTGQPQKLLYADADLPSDEDVAALAGNPCWEEKKR